MMNPPSDFLKYIGTPFEPYILPIIPAGAELIEASKLSPEQLGKIPGKWFPQPRKWAGFYGWQAHRATRFDIERWHGWQDDDKYGSAIALCLRTNYLPAVDIDVNNAAIAAEVRLLVQLRLGAPGAVRCRHGSPRQLMFYGHKPHTAPITKGRLAWTIVETGEECAIEILGHGQQGVAEGPHAKGAMHYWENGQGLIEGFETMRDNLLTIEDIDQMMVALRDWIDNDPRFERKKLSLPTGGTGEHAVSIEDLMSRNRVKGDDGMALLARAIDAIDINAPLLSDYHTWLNLLRAIKAACGGDQAFYADHVLPWLQQNSGNAAKGEEWLEARWESFKDSELGASYVFGVASAFGFKEGNSERAPDIFAGHPNPLEARDEVDQDTAGSGSNSTALPFGAGAAGGGGPLAPRDTHRALALDFITLHGHEWRFSTDAKRWYRYDATAGIWRTDEGVISIIGAMLANVAQTIRRTVMGPNGEQRARNLESAGAVFAVERLLRGEPTMMAQERDFDADAHLLNTPSWVVDLRTGQFYQHDASYLMRQSTLIDPDVTAIVPWEHMDDSAALQAHMAARMPRFLFTLKNLDGTHHADGANGDFIPATGAVYGYVLIGEIRHASIFFLEGEPGLGKTQVWQVLYEAMAGKLDTGYAKQVTAAFIQKNGEGHRFDMATIIGKRMLFLDETMLAMSFDEARMSMLGSGDTIECEIKFGRDSVKFVNRAKLCISGNHRPHFVSGEAGGLASRLMLIEAKGENLRGSAVDIHNVASQIVAEEGPAVLTWAIQNAVLDYAEGGHARFHRLMASAKAAAAEYTRQDSTVVQWVESRMELGEGLEIDLVDAFTSYKDYQKSVGEKSNVKQSDLKRLLQAAYKGQLEFPKRTTRPHPNRIYIKGLGNPRPVDANGNIVAFPGQQQKREV